MQEIGRPTRVQSSRAGAGLSGELSRYSPGQWLEARLSVILRPITRDPPPLRAALDVVVTDGYLGAVT